MGAAGFAPARIWFLLDAEFRDRLRPEEVLKAREHHAARAIDFERPSRIRRSHRQHAVHQIDSMSTWRAPGPTASCQANVVRAGDGGWRRTMSARTPALN